MALQSLGRCYQNGQWTRVLTSVTTFRSCELAERHRIGYVTPKVWMASTAATGEAPLGTKLLTMSDMPGPRAYPVIGSMKILPPDKIVPFFRERCVNYYPIYKEKIFNQHMVVLTGIEAIEKFFRNEAKYPNRFEFPLWMEYREVSGEEHGVFTGRDVHWHKMRTVVDKPMLRLKDVMSYTDELNEVVTDMLDRLGQIRDGDNVVPDIEKELFNWSLESIGTILYEKRFGGLSNHRDPEMEEFIDAVQNMLILTTELFMLPLWVVKIFKRKPYNQHKEAWDTLFRIARKCVDERMDIISKKMEQGEEVEGMLAYFLSRKTLTPKEIYSNVTELMMAAVDTTSNTLLWCLNEISHRPDVQGKLFEEVQEAVPGGQIPTYRDLQKLPYLKAVIKETLRMYPAAGGVSRILEEDMELCGYLIPRKTAVNVPVYAVSRLPQYFEDPDDFKPERWLGDRSERPNPFASLPFGVGTRMCVGRRIAELELYLLLSRLVQRYKVEPTSNEPVHISMRLILRPHRQIKIRLVDRS